MLQWKFSGHFICRCYPDRDKGTNIIIIYSSTEKERNKKNCIKGSR